MAPSFATPWRVQAPLLEPLDLTMLFIPETFSEMFVFFVFEIKVKLYVCKMMREGEITFEK